MKFNFGDLERLFEKINDIIDYVKLADLKNRRNTLYLCNEDDYIVYSVPETSIAHLLGINTTYLIGTGVFRNKNSYELLKEMCENPYRIHTLSESGIIDQTLLFSEHILEKVESFKENIKINAFDTKFMCKYNKEKAYYSGEKNENCDYIMVKQYEDEKVGVILLANNNYIFAPMSNRIYNNMEEASKYLKTLLTGQELTLLSGTRSYNTQSDYEKSYILNPNVKREKFCELKVYKKLFNCSIDMSNDYEYMSDKLFTKRDEGFENKLVINDIIEAIINGRIIEKASFSDTRLKTIIDAWNDHICSNPNSQEGEKTFTEIVKELKVAKDLITELNNKIETLESQNLTLSDENTSLNEKNKQYEANEQAIMKILKRPEI